MEKQIHRKNCQGDCCKKNKSNKGTLAFIILGLSSLFWLIIRSGRKPSRLQYPCQQVAAGNAVAFLSWMAAIFGVNAIYRKMRKIPVKFSLFLTSIFLFVLGVSAFWGSFSKYRQSLNQPMVISQGTNPRVVWVTDSNATNGWAGNSSAVNQTVVNNMVDEAIKAMAGMSNVRDAWTYIFQTHNGGADYAVGEKIAIKVNFNNAWGDAGDSNNCITNHCPTYQVINALLRQLITEKGINRANITIYDTRKVFPNYYTNGINALYSGVSMNPNSFDFCADAVLGTKFGCVLSNTKYLINMPLLRTHGGPGVTLSLKNHLGSTEIPSTFHDGNMLENSSNSFVQLNNHPIIRDKTILVLNDALYGLKSGGPGGNPSGGQGITNPFPNSIFVSMDPLAIDSIAMDYIQSRGSSFNGKTYRIPYIAAANAELGTYATSCVGTSTTCSFNYGTALDLVHCDHQGTMDAECSGVTPPSPGSCAGITGPEGEVQAGATLTYQGTTSAGTVNTIRWFLDDNQDASGNGKLTYQVTAPGSGTHTVRMSVNGDNVDACRKIFTIAEEPELPVCPGGTWKTHENSCEDSCFYAQDPNLSCTPVISEGCDCGSGGCWDGFNCVSNPATDEPAVEYGITELILLTSKWGTSGPVGDIDQDGNVDIEDLIILVKNWK